MKCFVVLSLIIACFSNPSCIGIENDNATTKPIPVDWYVVNLIGLDKHSNKVVIDYMDSTMEVSGGKPTRYALSESETPMIHTVSELDKEYLNKSEQMLVLAWNDHPSGEKVTGNHAHSKGVLAFDNTKGFLLNHSLPKFPRSDKKLFSEEFDNNFGKYMQHFYCENYEKSALSTISEALYTIKPNIFTHKSGKNFNDLNNSYLKAIIDSKAVHSLKSNSTKVLQIHKTVRSNSHSTNKPLRNKLKASKKQKITKPIPKNKHSSKVNAVAFIAINRGRSVSKDKNTHGNSKNSRSKVISKSKNTPKGSKSSGGNAIQGAYLSKNTGSVQKTINFFVKPHVEMKYLPWNKEIVDKYKKDFYSLTWRAKSMDTDKNIGNKVFTVSKIKTGADNSMEIESDSKNIPEEKKHTKNHAKWSVSTDGEIVCLGDLNHDPTQLKRGGMIICFENKIVASYFLNRIEQHN